MRAIQLVVAGTALTMTGAAHAQPIVVADSGDSAWVLSASALILIAAMPGLALVHGRGRAGPTGLALFVSAALVSLLFAAIGYSLAFGEGSTLLGGAGNAMLADLADLRGDTTIAESVFVLFQLVIAIFAVGIVTASVAERTRLGWLAAFSALWALLVYVPTVRWLWGGGWLAELGAIDYAGGIVVQTTAGVAALVVALLLGRPRESDVAHDSRLAPAGMALIWVGWFGLVGGWALAGGGDAASAMLNAELAASAALLTGLAIERWRDGHVSVYGAAASAVAGLAAVSAGAFFVSPGGAMTLGILGALGAWAAAALTARLRVGGAASAFVAHGSGGIVGAIAFPVFVLPMFGGPGFDDGVTFAAQMLVQSVAVVAIVAWTAAMTAIMALMVGTLLPMRIDQRRD